MERSTEYLETLEKLTVYENRHTLAKLFEDVQDSGSQWSKLFNELEITESGKAGKKKSFDTGGKGVYEVYDEILSVWASEKGFTATFGLLFQALRAIKWNSPIDKIRNHPWEELNRLSQPGNENPLPTTVFRNSKRRRLDFMEKYPNFVAAFKKKICIALQAETSASAETREKTDLFFEPFMAYPVVLHLDEDDEFLVEPKHWASAFMETDLHEIAFILTRATFTPEDIIHRKVHGNRDNHSIIKRGAIRRGAKWLMNKNQDPWSFQCQDIDQSEMLTDEENEAIRTAFERIVESEIYPAPNFKMEMLETMTPRSLRNPIKMEEVMPKLEEIAKKLSQNHSGDILSGYHRLFREVLELGVLGNSAQTAKSLTRIGMPTNGDVFVDAVQFSKNRWTGAGEFNLNKSSSEELKTLLMAERLFRGYWSKLCTKAGSSFPNVEAMCSVRRLAVIRGALWLSKNPKNIYDFDPAVPDHNIGFCTKEIEEKVFQKYVRKIKCHTTGDPISDPCYLAPTTSATNNFVSPSSPTSSTGNSMLNGLDVNMEHPEALPTFQCSMDPNFKASLVTLIVDGQPAQQCMLIPLNQQIQLTTNTSYSNPVVPVDRGTPAMNSDTATSGPPNDSGIEDSCHTSTSDFCQDFHPTDIEDSNLNSLSGHSSMEVSENWLSKSVLCLPENEGI